MSAVISPPYLRWLTRLLRWAARGLGVLLLITVLAWVLLHVWIVPRIDQWRPDIARWATQRLGATVEIGHIAASSNGWRPQFQLSRVRLLSPKGEVALDLPQARVAMSPWSAWQLSLDELRLDAPELQVERRQDGRVVVAGFEVPSQQAGNAGGDAWNWLLKQRHVLIQGGQVHLRDALAGTPPLTLQALDLSLSNHHHKHRLRLAATPPAEWGQRFSWQADLRSPLWRPQVALAQLSGPVYAEFPQLNVAALRKHVSAGVDLQAASGALRMWLDVKNGQWQRATADVAVNRIQARFAKDLSPLDLRDVAGRVVWETRPEGFSLQGRDLQFATADGQRWQGAQVRVTSDTPPQGQASTELEAEQVNLAALRQVLMGLPLDDALRDALRAHPVSGRVNQLTANWSRNAEGQLHYRAKGQVRKLLVAASPGEDGHAGTPGVRAADVDFELTETGGQADLRMAGGSLSFPGVFEEPEIPVESLSADVRWTIAGADIGVQVEQLKLRNADAQGEFKASWQTKPQAQLAEGESRFPGTLKLTGQLSRANGARVYRYLPLGVGNEARHYVKDAVLSGEARQVAVTVEGDLHHFPFADGKQGTFRIIAPVQQVQLRYVPRYLQHANEPDWPVLEHLAGSLEFEGNSMRVRKASGRARGFPSLQFSHIEADIADLAHTEVRVQASGASTAEDGLRFVRASPVAAWLHGALDDMQANHSVSLKLGLDLPIARMHESRVSGEVGLQGNDIKLRDDVPLLQQAQGRIGFTEQGFTLHEARAQAVGGPVSLTGGTEAVAGGASRTVIDAAGHATASGLQTEPVLTTARPLLARASGQTEFRVRYAVQNGQTQVQVSSPMTGLALNLPAPLHKSAEAALPLQFAITPGKGEDDTLSLQLGDMLDARYQRRQREGHMQVQGGQLMLGKVAALPVADGVRLRAELPEMDVDAWRRVFSAQATSVGAGLPAAAASAAASAPAEAVSPGASAPASAGVITPAGAVPAPAKAGLAASSAAPSVVMASPAVRPPWLAASAPSPAPAASGATRGGASEAWAVSKAPASNSGDAQQYLPQQVEVKTPRLHVEGKLLSGVKLLGSHQGNEWVADIDADHLAGQVRYRDDGAGRLHARLRKLHVPEDEVDTDPQLMTHPPSSLPGMDIVVDDLRLGEKRLGQLSFKADNRGASGGAQAWRIEMLKLAGAGGTLQANGAWQAADQQGLRHTELVFAFDLDDAGALLARLGMPGVLRKGQGEIRGQLSWQGSPLQPHPPSMAGQVQVDVTKGQFLKADPGLAKLLGVLSLQSLPRRLTLDFRDLFSEGFAYDFIRGDARLQAGVAHTNNLQMKGVNAAVLLEGQADLAKSTQDLRVIVAPRIDAGGAALVATVINPAIGIGTFLAQLVLSKQINEAATRTFHVTGTWTEPTVTRVETVRGTTAEPPANAASAASR